MITFHVVHATNLLVPRSYTWSCMSMFAVVVNA